MASLANTLQFLTSPRQIPAASPEFLASAKNPNIRNFAPGREPSFTNPMFASLANLLGSGGGSGTQPLMQPLSAVEQTGFKGLDLMRNRQAILDAAIAAQTQ